MPVPQFKIGIKNNTTADAGDSVLDLYFLDSIQNPEYFDWNTMQVEEGSLVSDVISQVQYYQPSRIILHIDSFGGNLDIAIALYNFLKDYPAKVETKIIAFCASAATVVGCSANKGKLTMAKNGFYITHEAEGNQITGRAKDIRQQADVIDKMTRQMAEILAGRNTKGHTADEILALWKDGDCWMSGTEAEEYGFVDACYNTETAMVTARVKEAAQLFKNAPSTAITAEVNHEVEPSHTILTKIENAMKSFNEMVTAALDKIKGTKITAKVEGTNNTVDVTDVVTAAFQPMMADLAANIQTEVTAEITKIKDEVTAAMKTEYGKTITDLQAENITLKKDVETITADVTAMAGAESRPGAKGTGAAATQPNGKKVRPSLAGEEVA